MRRISYLDKIIIFEKKILLLILVVFCMLTITFPRQISAKDEDVDFPYKEVCFSKFEELDFEKLSVEMKDLSRNNPAKLYVSAMNLDETNESSKDIKKDVVKLLESSAKRGCGNAKIELWYRYAVGRGVEQDNTLATYWAKKALDSDYGNAQIGRWFMYISGAEQKNSPHWDRNFSYDDNPEVLYHLGLMYATGLGIKQDYLNASKWYERAAKRGYTQAQYNLGILYALGKGVDIDNIKAYALIDLATQSGHKQAEVLREILRKSLDDRQIKIANRIASNFVKR